MKKIIIFTLSLLVFCLAGIAQTQLVAQTDTGPKKERKSRPGAIKKHGNVVAARIVDGDTIPTVNLRPVRITGERKFVSAEEKRKYYLLKRKVKKVYPYAKLAGQKLREYEKVMASMTERQRKKYMKKVEKELKDEFEGDLKDLTVSEGRILIRLIDRETGDSSYYLVKELRSGFTAFFWQGLARLFGHNLKTKYDPSQGEDKMIEEIIQGLETNG